MKITPSTTVGIIGGAGRTGAQFARLFSTWGCPVSVTGEQTKHQNPELLARCDIVVFSVPLRTSVAIMEEEIVHATRRDQLLLDVSSLKGKQVEVMLRSAGEVIGMHPLFGPWTDPRQETVILCPARCAEETVAALERMLHGLTLKTLRMSPEEHDRQMALLQALPHLKSLLLADALKRLGADLETLLPLCTPSYELEFNLIGRFLDDDPDLYGPIVFENPETVRILRMLRDLLDEYLGIAEQHDLSVFSRKYADLKHFFGDHAKRARLHSEACIRTLTGLPP